MANIVLINNERDHGNDRNVLTFLFLLFALFGFANAANAATYYASPTGSGATCSQASPCAVAGGVAKLIAGDTLWLLDGTYTGDSGMIFANNIDGRADARITIAALNDGAVTIDGQNVRDTVWIFNSNYITVQGINAHNAGNNGVPFYISSNSGPTGFNELKRCVGWNANNENGVIIVVNAQHDTLVEDCAAFGMTRGMIEDFYAAGGGRNEFRRVWMRYTGGNVTNQPKYGALLSYNSVQDTLWENNIVEWKYLGGNNANIYGFIAHDNSQHVTAPVMLGNIAILRPGDAFGGTGMFFFSSGALNAIVQNNIVYSSGHISTIPFYMTNSSGVNFADHNTSIKGTGQASIWASNWTNTNFLEQPTIGSYNLYTNTGAGATIRYRYQNGALTSTPLWPWPMASRIKAALNASGYDTNYDIDSTIQGIFGSYPSGSTPAPSPTYSTADLNSDGKVNSVDAAILMGAWGQTSKPKADINQDGIVNSVDAAIMMGEWSL